MENQILFFDTAIAEDQSELIKKAGGRTVHKFGRIHVADLQNNRHQVRDLIADSAEIALDGSENIPNLTRSEKLALAGMRKRARQGFQTFTTPRSTDGRSWDELDLPGDDEDNHEFGTVSQAVSASALEVLPKPERLINKTAVALVFVEGVQPEFRISEEERENVLAHWQEATTWISSMRPTANISWDTKVYEATVDIVPWKDAPWPGLPNYDGFSAILNTSHNGRIYVFEVNVKANSSSPLPTYYRISSIAAGMDDGYPKNIGDHWTIPAAFQGGVDACFWRESNQKIYLFKGSEYIRVNPENFTVDPAYTTPKQIADGWTGIDPEFAKGVDAVLGHKENNSVYMFKGDRYIKFTNGSSTMTPGYPKPIADHWGGAEKLGKFAEGIDCAFWRDSIQKIYLFKNSRFGGKYIRIDPNSFEVDESYEGGKYIGLSKEDAEALWRNPALEQLGVAGSHDGGRQLAAKLRDATNSDQAIVVYVTKLPTVHSAYAGGYRFTLSKPDLNADISRVMAHETLHLFEAKDEYKTTSSCTEEYGRFFKAKNTNSQACSSPPVNCIMDSDGPSMCKYTPLHIGWGAFETQIDAAVYRGDNNNTYLFSGEYYIRYSDINAGRDADYPRKISSAWLGLPSEFKKGLDGALWREDNQRLYFFKGDQYVRFSPGSNTVDQGYPVDIKDGFRGMPFTFQSDLDCVFWRDSNNRIYMFKGDKYVRLVKTDGVINMENGYPKSIATSFSGLNTGSSNVNAALMRRDTNQIYFFHGTKYTRFSSVSEGADTGYPRNINGVWMPFPK